MGQESSRPLDTKPPRRVSFLSTLHRYTANPNAVLVLGEEKPTDTKKGLELVEIRFHRRGTLQIFAKVLNAETGALRETIKCDIDTSFLHITDSLFYCPEVTYRSNRHWLAGTMSVKIEQEVKSDTVETIVDLKLRPILRYEVPFRERMTFIHRDNEDSEPFEQLLIDVHRTLSTVEKDVTNVYKLKLADARKILLEADDLISVEGGDYPLLALKLRKFINFHVRDMERTWKGEFFRAEWDGFCDFFPLTRQDLVAAKIPVITSE